jgi:N-methylhydantoinase B
VIFAALAAAIPERVNAMAYGTINALSIAGYRKDAQGKDQRWVMFSFFGGGHGGHPEGDGLNHGNAPISTATIPPFEILEAAYPIQFTQWALRPDSAGAGRHRGGLGAVYEIELLEQEAEAFVFGERGRFAPAGALGGKPAAKNRFRWKNGATWRSPPLKSKMSGIKLKRGDRVRLETPGGGGYGNPRERSAEAIASDARLGYVTAKRKAKAKTKPKASRR